MWIGVIVSEGGSLSAGSTVSLKTVSSAEGRRLKRAIADHPYGFRVNLDELKLDTRDNHPGVTALQLTRAALYFPPTASELLTLQAHTDPLAMAAPMIGLANKPEGDRFVFVYCLSFCLVRSGPFVNSFW
jgi:hypothetical protein